MGLDSSNVVAWHDRTPEQHAELLDTWADKDYRTMTLSLYGSTSAPLFAAVMVKRPKVIATRHVGPMGQNAMQEEFEEKAKSGWGPFILTATGTRENPLFAAVFTPMDAIPLTRLNLSKEQFEEVNDEQMGAGNILVWADAFGTSDDVRYTAIWGPNPGRVVWSADAVDEGGSDLQNRFIALRATGNRPAHVSVTPSGKYLEVFVDSAIGEWSSRVDMSSAEYDEAFSEQAKKGLWPIRVSAAGAGAGARFAAIWASKEEIDEPAFRSSGPVTVAGIDAAMEAYVRDHNLRGVALAVTRGSRLVYVKGYTYAHPGYPDVEPTTLFRQASVSKSFAAVALWRLLQDRSDITLDTTLQSVLALEQPDGSAPKDGRFADITLRHLLESNSGLPQDMIWRVGEASDAFGGSLPATHLELARYATTKDLTGTPGSPTNVVYGNFDYLLIGLVVAKLAGTQTFEQALQQLVLDPLRMTRTRGSVSDVDAQPADEARHHLRVYNPTNSWPLIPMELAPSVRHADKRLVAAQYGGWDYELFDGCGGLSSAVVDVARFAAMFSDRVGNPVLAAATIDDLLQHSADATAKLSGPDDHGYHGFDWASIDDAANNVVTASKGGWLPGQGSVVRFTTGGFGYVIAQNGNAWAGVTTKWLEGVAAAAQANDWGDNDLFPQYGMPSLTGSLLSGIHITTATKAVLAEQLAENVQASMVRAIPERLRVSRRSRIRLPRPQRDDDR